MRASPVFPPATTEKNRGAAFIAQGRDCVNHTARADSSSHFARSAAVSPRPAAALSLFRNEWDIVRDVAAQVPGQNPRLYEWHLGNAQVLIEQRMIQRLLLSLLVGGDDELAAGYSVGLSSVPSTSVSCRACLQRAGCTTSIRTIISLTCCSGLVSILNRRSMN